MITPPDINAPGAPRPARPVQLIALDLDGTCVDWNQQLHPRIVEAVDAAMATGVIVVVVTGRMYRAALPWAERMHVTVPLVCYQGASVRAMPGPGQTEVNGVRLGALVEAFPIEPEVAVEVLHMARENNWHLQAFQDEQLLCERDRPEVHFYTKITHVPFTVIGDMEPLLRAGSMKLTCVVLDPPEAQRCEDTISERFGRRARVVRSLPEFVELTNLRASKGLALERLCSRLAIDMADTAAIGDAPNDIPMFEAVAYAVAVRTDDGRMLSVVDAVCAPPTEAGVADVLEALVPARTGV